MPLEALPKAIDELEGALPPHQYSQVIHNRSHGAASAYGHLRIHHDRYIKCLREGGNTAIEYPLLMDAIQDYRDFIQENGEWVDPYGPPGSPITDYMVLAGKVEDLNAVYVAFDKVQKDNTDIPPYSSDGDFHTNLANYNAWADARAANSSQLNAAVKRYYSSNKQP